MNEKQQDRKDKFEEELNELLISHGVMLRLTDDRKEYGLHSPVLMFDFNDKVTYQGRILSYEFEVNFDDLILEWN